MNRNDVIKHIHAGVVVAFCLTEKFEGRIFEEAEQRVKEFCGLILQAFQKAMSIRIFEVRREKDRGL